MDPASAVPETDSDLLEQRRPEAVEHWFLEHVDALYTYVFYRIGKDPELAADVVQETFVTALDRIADYDPGRGAMATWLAFTARNHIRSALRHKRRTLGENELWSTIDAKTIAAYADMAHTPLPDEVLEKRETAELVHMTLASLPVHYRVALTRHYCQHHSLSEIAESRGMTDGSVKSLLHRARSAFKTAFLTIVESIDESASRRRMTT